MIRRAIAILVAITGIAALAGCSKSGNPMAPAPAGFGSVTVQMTDAPAAFDHVFLDVREIWVHRLDDGGPGDTLTEGDDDHGRHHGHGGDGGRDSLGGGDSTVADHERDEHGMWHRLDGDAAIVDLLDLRNGVFKTLATGRVPAGSYDQVRLVLGSDNSVVVDGVTHPLKVPSGQSSGFKLVGRFDVPVEGDVDVGIDFDAARSLHRTGNGTWILNPVARIEALSTTGRIHGRIDPGSAVSWVYAMQGADTVATTLSKDDGNFVLALLPTGDYAVHITPTVAGFRDTTLAPVHVEAGQTTELGVIALGGTPPSPGKIVGRVAPDTVVTNVKLMQGSTVRDSTTTVAAGFAFNTVAPGTYDLVLTPQNAHFVPKTVTGVVVGSGATTDVGTITLDAAAARRMALRR